METIRYIGLGLSVFGLARMLNFGIDGFALLSAGAGVVALVAGYADYLKIGNLNVFSNIKMPAFNSSSETEDMRAVRYLTERFGKAGNKEALELLRKVNDLLFLLNTPEYKDEVKVPNTSA